MRLARAARWCCGCWPPHGPAPPPRRPAVVSRFLVPSVRSNVAETYRECSGSSAPFKEEVPVAFIGFDVYGTLVDPLGMERPLVAHVGQQAAFKFAAAWRQHQLESAFRRALMRR